MDSNQVVIIGAGVAGISLAYHLAKLGIKAVILEKEATAANHASGKNAGMIRQLYRNPQLTQWATKSIADMPANLKEQFFIQTGSIVVGRMIPDHHQDIFIQDQNSVRCKTDGLLDSGPFVQALLALAKSKGANCHFNQQVIEIKKSDVTWEIKTQNNVYKTSCLVNASGAWVNAIAGLPNKIAVQAYARHLAIIEGFPEGYMPASDCGFYWDENESWYLRKWDKTSRLVSICDQVACDVEVLPNSEEIKEKMANTLLKHLPEVANNLKIRNFWHCYRTYTEDRLPVIGKDINDDSFFWLSGFGGFGMSTAYAASEDAARLISGKICPALESFSPSRCNIY